MCSGNLGHLHFCRLAISVFRKVDSGFQAMSNRVSKQQTNFFEIVPPPTSIKLFSTLTIPVTVTTSPGMQQSTRSSVSSHSIVRGTRPSSRFSALASSWILDENKKPELSAINREWRRWSIYHLPYFLKIYQLGSRSHWGECSALATLNYAGYWRWKFPIREHTADGCSTLHALEIQLQN
jgi:hypothetical protein